MPQKKNKKTNKQNKQPATERLTRAVTSPTFQDSRYGLLSIKIPVFDSESQALVNHISSLMILVSLSVLRLESFLDDDDETLAQNEQYGLMEIKS